MKGMSFVNSPMKQDKMKMQKTAGEKATPKYTLKVGTLVGGSKEYFKVDEKYHNQSQIIIQDYYDMLKLADLKRQIHMLNDW